MNFDEYEQKQHEVDSRGTGIEDIIPMQRIKMSTASPIKQPSDDRYVLMCKKGLVPFFSTMY